MSEPRLAYNLVDVFTFSPYAGNVAGVVMDAEGLNEKQMLLITRELGAPATAFILPATTKEAAARLRWFSQGGELSFCGHGTLASAHVLFECLRGSQDPAAPAAALPIECRAGIVSVRADSHPVAGKPPTIWLDMPHCEPKSGQVFLPPWVERLGLSMKDIDPRIPAIRTQDDDIIFAVRELQTLLTLAPASADLARHSRKEGIRGFLVTTTQAISSATVVQSRFFAPSIGIEEDPVTGSVHGPLGFHLVKSGVVPLVGGKADFLCAQGKSGGRAGVVRIAVSQSAAGEQAVRIGGSCVTTAAGIIHHLPPVE